jgi:hypothetical protein
MTNLKPQADGFAESAELALADLSLTHHHILQ